MGVSFLWKHAGLVTIWIGFWTIHFGVSKSHQHWGYHEDYYDGTWKSIGIGPLVLFCWY